MPKDNKPGSEQFNATDLTPADDQHEAISQARRELLKKVAKGATFAAPATLALMSMQAKACSFSC